MSKIRGTFAPSQIAYSGFTVNKGGWVSQDKYPRHVADVNGDGRADIVGFGGDAVYVSLGQTDGTFPSHQTAYSNSFTVNKGGWVSQDKYPRHVADVNGDGRADIVGFGSNAVYVSLGQTDGNFAPHQTAYSNNFTVNKGGWVSQDKYPRHVADVNGDGRDDIVGFASNAVDVSLSEFPSPFTIIENEGTATFAKDKNRNYLIINGDKELQLQNRQGKTYSDNTNLSWVAVAVELDSKSENEDNYRVLLQGQNARDGQAYVWKTNSDGVITKGSGWKSGDALLPIENEFSIDLNNDELIGSPLTIIENEGTATFAKDKNRNYLIINGDKELQLQNRQGKTYSDNTNLSWDAVAVELDSKSENEDNYRVLLQGQNARDGQAYVWTTNSDGVITKGSGWKSGDALLPFEQEFNIDLNGDSLII
jgi:biopolymer transport protein ExbD